MDSGPTVVEPRRRDAIADDAIDASQRPIAPRTVPVADPAPEFIDSRELEQTTMKEPVYPPSAMRARQEGWVTLELTVSERGDVRDMLVTDAEPAGVFDAAALDAVRQWRFKPRVANGRAVAVRSSVTLRFAVDP